MMVLKKTAAALAVFFLGSALLSATSFDVTVSAGYKGVPCVGLSSNVSQNITETLTIDSSVLHLANHEYEATLKGTHQVTPWFAAGAGFLLFTDESAMLPAITGSIQFTSSKKWISGFTGGFGLNEKHLSKPYLFKAGHYAHFITHESIIDFNFEWQNLNPGEFVRNDYSGDLKIYAISPDNEKFKLCLGMNGSYHTDTRTEAPFSATAGLSFGFDYGTAEQGYSLTYSITPVSMAGLDFQSTPVFWTISSGIRFLY